MKLAGVFSTLINSKNQGSQVLTVSSNLTFFQNQGSRIPTRSHHILLAQVPVYFGAGVQNEVRPAPLESVERRFTAQVPRVKPHLRQEGARPAPRFNYS